jgi:hypothetical protein
MFNLNHNSQQWTDLGSLDVFNDFGKVTVLVCCDSKVEIAN